jgi:hypothetical protein
MEIHQCKTCKICNKEKPIENYRFHKDKDYYENNCKVCVRLKRMAKVEEMKITNKDK